jgi:Protein of unknown function (DUF3667)
MSAVAPPVAGASAQPEAAEPASAAVAAAATPAVARCANCGASLAGRYCAQCGQRVEPPVHSLWHFGKVATEDLTHADSRLWRTLAALLFKPGRLTAEFLAGRRARYLPPVRLYLVLSVIFFVYTAAGSTRVYVLSVDPQERSAGFTTLKDVTADDAARATETPEQRTKRLCDGLTYHGPFAAHMQPLSMNACRRIAADQGRALQAAVMHNVPRAMFVFLPLLAAAMKLMYWAPRHYYVEHLLLLVHYHAFVFLLVPLAWLLYTLLPRTTPWIELAVTLYIPWYLYRSMRVVYGQGRLLTVSKLLLLCFVYLVSGALMLALTSTYTALTM